MNTDKIRDATYALERERKALAWIDDCLRNGAPEGLQFRAGVYDPDYRRSYPDELRPVEASKVLSQAIIEALPAILARSHVLLTESIAAQESIIRDEVARP